MCFLLSLLCFGWSTQNLGLRKTTIHKNSSVTFHGSNGHWIILDQVDTSQCKVYEGSTQHHPTHEGHLVIKGVDININIHCGLERQVFVWTIPEDICPSVLFIKKMKTTSVDPHTGVCFIPEVTMDKRTIRSFVNKPSRTVKIWLHDLNTKPFTKWLATKEQKTEVDGPFFASIMNNGVEQISATVDFPFPGTNLNPKQNQQTKSTTQATKKVGKTKYLAIGGVSSIAVVLGTAIVALMRRTKRDELTA